MRDAKENREKKMAARAPAQEARERISPSGIQAATLSSRFIYGLARTDWAKDKLLVLYIIANYFSSFLICSLDVDPLLSFCRFSNIAYEETG